MSQSLTSTIGSYASTALITTTGLCLLALAARGLVNANMERKSNVKKRKRRKTKASTSTSLPGSVATPLDEIDESDVAPAVGIEDRKPLAERRLAAKRRKQPRAVQDMLDPDVKANQEPSAQRVVSLASKPSISAAAVSAEDGFGYSSWEQVGGSESDHRETEPEREPVWQEVAAKPRVASLSKSLFAFRYRAECTSEIGTSTPETTSPSKTVPGLPADTKRARQNAAKSVIHFTLYYDSRLVSGKRYRSR